jgi:hypothetical protein
VLLNLGVVAQRERDYDQALVRFSQSLKAAKLAKNVDVQIAASEGIGVALTGRNDFVGATKVLDETLANTRVLKDKTREAELLWRSAELCYEMKNYERSSALSQAALELAKLTHSAKLSYLATG